MKTYLPIKVKSTPIRKLALVPFEKRQDNIYSGWNYNILMVSPMERGIG